MPVLNRLEEKHLRVVDRIFAWMLIMFGFVIPLGMVSDHAGWDDPVFNVMRKVPYTPYSWAAVLVVATAIYAIGELSSSRNMWRGKVVIVGASLCSFWCLAMSLAMSRMVYTYPGRITDLWPIVMFFWASLYFTRIIVYANTFTGKRWNTQPHQLWPTVLLLLSSVLQVVIGLIHTSVLTEVSQPVSLLLSSANMVGAIIVLFGLHLRDKEIALNLEAAGSFTLMCTLSWYVANIFNREPLGVTAITFAITGGFLIGTLHRGIQIGCLRYFERQDDTVRANRLRCALDGSASD